MKNKIKKTVKVYKDTNEMDKADKKYWKSASMEEREIVRDALWENYCFFKGIDPNVQRFTRVLRVVKFPPS